MNPTSVAALLAPDAGNLIPYEYAIALLENAVDNGVELRIRREVISIDKMDSTDKNGLFTVKANHWEPKEYIDAFTAPPSSGRYSFLPLLTACGLAALCSLGMQHSSPEMSDMVSTIGVDKSNYLYVMGGAVIGVQCISVAFNHFSKVCTYMYVCIYVYTSRNMYMCGYRFYMYYYFYCFLLLLLLLFLLLLLLFYCCCCTFFYYYLYYYNSYSY